MWQDTIKLGFYNNLLIGNTTDKLTLARVAEKVKKDLESGRQIDIGSYGLFDSTAPNYTTYYPDVTAADIAPKDAEFIEPPFRALSEVIVHKNWNPVDFAEGGVVKNSMKMLLGATVNPDHESHVVGNALGAVSGVAWEESYKTGIYRVPAGINAALKIDSKSNPRIARGILMDPPSIHSTSVTVMFLWDKSHPSMADQEFFSKLGTFDKDGKMIRRMATLIKKYPEISLVTHGADPYAQKINSDGKIVNPAYADVTYNSATPDKRKEMRQSEKYFIFDFKTDIIENTEQTTTPAQSNTENQNQSNMDLLAILREKLGLAADADQAAVEAALTAAITARTTAEASVASLTTEVARLKPLETELTQLKATDTTAELARLKTAETTALTAKRTAVTALLQKVKDNKADAATLAMVQNSDINALTVLEQEYGTQLEAKFPLSCKKCGGKDITRASAAKTDPTKEPGSENGTPVPKTKEELRESFQNRNKAGSIPMPGTAAKK